MAVGSLYLLFSSATKRTCKSLGAMLLYLRPGVPFPILSRGVSRDIMGEISGSRSPAGSALWCRQCRQTPAGRFSLICPDLHVRDLGVPVPEMHLHDLLRLPPNYVGGRELFPLCTTGYKDSHPHRHSSPLSLCPL